MKKCISIIISTLLLFSLTGCAAGGAQVTPVSSAPPVASAVAGTALPQQTAAEPSALPIADKLAGKALNDFNLDVTLDPENHTLEVSQLLDYHNSTDTQLSEIYFNLIPDALEENGGGIDLSAVTAGGSDALLQRGEQTVFSMPLSTPLGTGETLSIQMEYTVRIPDIQNRFGYQENVYNVGNFIITPAVYDENGWAIEPYATLGDAFYTDIANYDVAIHAPEGYTVAATGDRQANGSFHAEKVRDFAFCASDGYDTLEDTVDGISVTVYYGDDMTKTAARMMETAKKALSLYSGMFGAYPYDTLSVVSSGLTGGVNGMEYPTLIMVGTFVTLDNMEELGIDPAIPEDLAYCTADIDRAVAHEIAHQWFYGVVGNDQIRYPWLDEGLCRFAEYLYLDAYPVENLDDGYSLEQSLTFEHQFVMEDNEFGAVDLSLSLYDWQKQEAADYSGIYNRTASLLYQMRVQMGETAFSKAIKEYVDTFAYGFVTPEGFQQFWNGKDDFSELFTLYFQ
ncbi:M1 family metallopeptidase [Christensenella hongkongensis]|uniref:M1 family metallopeptidase n=1 Tax=Christensenella hongkongensis TaxID=270498 RepID=UPI002671D03E|nr:M1 family metallopeptidase [Christensenella hongkongensis]